MIRPAKTTDVFAITDILVERSHDSRYEGIAAIDPKLARQMFAQAVQRHGGFTEGATFLMVNETKGEIDAFMFGTLNRIYVVGDKLAASDVFLLGKKDCNPRAMSRLIDAYVRWAEASPKVVEIGLSWADSLPGTEAITKDYERRGFTLRAKTYTREIRREAMELAA